MSPIALLFNIRKTEIPENLETKLPNISEAGGNTFLKEALPTRAWIRI
jgi:hypothetical protein